jgi:hypothetical protein
MYVAVCIEILRQMKHFTTASIEQKQDVHIITPTSDQRAGERERERKKERERSREREREREKINSVGDDQ